MTTRRRNRGVGRVLLLTLPAVVTATLLSSAAGHSVPGVRQAALAAQPAPAFVPLADRVNQRKKAVDQAIADMREQLEGTSQDLVDAMVTLKRTEVALDQARREEAKALKAEQAAKAQLVVMEGKQQQAKADSDAALAKVRLDNAAIARSREDLGRIARRAFVTNDSTGQLSVALDAASPEEFAAAMSAASTALRLQRSLQERLDTQIVESRQSAREARAAQSQAEAYAAAAAAVAEEKETAAGQASAARARIAQLQATQQAAVHVIEARKAAEQQRLDQLAAEQTRLRQILAARAAAALARARSHGGIVVTPGHGFLSIPAAGPITSGFGWRMHPIFHVRRLHTGTDFGVGCGTTVRAAADGTVVLADWAGGYGNRVVIDHGVVHGVSLATTYNHNTRLLVHAGQFVHRGEPISISGTTGSSTGCHLHFEVLVNGGYVNPMGWL